MYKLILISSFLFITFISCQKDNAADPFHYESDAPLWLKIKIESISEDHNYYGSEIYRYEWNEKFIYHIMIPTSSCAFCVLYYHNGDKVQLADGEFSDFLENKKNEVLIWEWEN